MQTTFEIGPGESTEGFWQKIMDSFGQRRVRVTVEEMEGAVSGSQYDVYLQLKALQNKFPPIKVDENIDLSRLADDASNVSI